MQSRVGLQAHPLQRGLAARLAGLQVGGGVVGVPVRAQERVVLGAPLAAVQVLTTAGVRTRHTGRGSGWALRSAPSCHSAHCNQNTIPVILKSSANYQPEVALHDTHPSALDEAPSLYQALRYPIRRIICATRYSTGQARIGPHAYRASHTSAASALCICVSLDTPPGQGSKGARPVVNAVDDAPQLPGLVAQHAVQAPAALLRLALPRVPAPPRTTPVCEVMGCIFRVDSTLNPEAQNTPTAMPDPACARAANADGRMSAGT